MRIIDRCKNIHIADSCNYMTKKEPTIDTLRMFNASLDS